MDSLVSYNTFYVSWHEAMSELTDEQYGRVSRALNEYCFFGTEPDLSGNEKIVFIMAKSSIDVSNKAKIGGKKGGEKGNGGAPEGNRNASKNKTIPPYCSEQYPPIEKNNSNGNGNGNGNENENGNGSSGSGEPPDQSILPAPSKAKPDKPKKQPLREREPENDYERVEKAYLQNWDALYAQNRVKTPDPVVNWNQTRALLKKHFEKLKPEQIIHAVNSAVNDDWIMSGGYSLGAMLSASALNRLINTARAEPPVSKRQREKLTFE